MARFRNRQIRNRHKGKTVNYGLNNKSYSYEEPTNISSRQDVSSSLKNTDVIINSDGSHTIKCLNNSCSQKLHIEEKMFGKQLICPTCKHKFIYSSDQVDLFTDDKEDEIDNENIFTFHCWKCGVEVQVNSFDKPDSVDCEKCGTTLLVPKE